MRKVERSDQLDSSPFLALFPSNSSHPDPPHLDLAIPLPVFPPPLPRRLWEQAGWSLGICEQDGHEEPLGLGSPGQLMLVEEEKAGKGGQRNSLMLREGTGLGCGLLDCGFLIFLLFLKKKPPSCVIFMGSAILAKIHFLI